MSLFGKKNSNPLELTNADKQEIEKIKDHLDTDEEVHMIAKQSKYKPGGAIISGGNIFFVTSKKILLRNPTMLGLRSSVEEIPYDQLTGVKLEKGVFSSTIVIRSPGLSEMSRMSKSSGLLAWGRGEEGAIDGIPKEKAQELVRIIREKMEQVKNKKTSNNSTEDPLRVLQVRFAKGEITKEEYDEMKSVLE